MTEGNLANGRLRFSRFFFFALSWALVVCIVVQTLFAGLAAFGKPEYWGRHVMFVHIFEMVPILMLIFSFIGRLPVSLRWHSAGLIALVFVQYFTANMPGMGGFHPVIALVMFWISLRAAALAWRWRSASPGEFRAGRSR
jgi:hypothetical protein